MTTSYLNNPGVLSPGLYSNRSIQEKIISVAPEHGLNATLSEMNRLETLSIKNPEFIKFIIETFSGCVPCYPGKIWRYIREKFIYTPDEYDESMTAPYLLVKSREGDCDDFSLFAKTCLDILGGWFTNYLLLGKTKDGFSHIVVFAHRGRSLFRYIDPVVIDGANSEFNTVKSIYINRKFVR